jgi:hypothetical protein
VACPQAIGECAASALALGAGARLEQLKADLIDLYPRLRQAFPKARILALGYSSLFPLKAPPLYKDHGVLRTLLFRRWALPEREAIRDWGFNLNRVILEATQVANSGIEFIDVGAYFAGHEPCSGGGEWVRFVGLINSVVRDGSFHPLQGGQAMMPGSCPATSPSSRSPSRRERRPPSMA